MSTVQENTPAVLKDACDFLIEGYSDLFLNDKRRSLIPLVMELNLNKSPDDFGVKLIPLFDEPTIYSMLPRLETRVNDPRIIGIAVIGLIEEDSTDFIVCWHNSWGSFSCKRYGYGEGNINLIEIHTVLEPRLARTFKTWEFV